MADRRLTMTLVSSLTALAITSCTITADSSDDPPSGAAPSAPVPICAKPDREVPLDLGIQASGTGPRGSELPISEVRRLVAEAKDTGADIISTTASWSHLRPRRDVDYDWEGMDRVIDVAGRAGLKVRIIVQTMPRWAQDAPATRGRWRAPRSEGELRRWRSFISDLATHVRGRVDMVEVWTDPNSGERWLTGPDPAEFLRLLSETRRVLDDVAPRITMISGGLAGNAIGYLEQLYAAQERLGGQTPFDRLGVNLVADGRAPTEGPQVESQEPFGLYDRTFMGYLLVRDLMDDRGDDDVPIYVTRFGYLVDEVDGVSEETRAEYAVQALSIASCDPRVSAFGWYNLHRTPFDDPGWSLLDADDRPTPTLQAISGWFADRGEPSTASSQ